MTTLLRRATQAGVPLAVALVWIADWAGGWAPDLAETLGYIVPGSAFVIAGLVAWSLRPRNRVGRLMMAVGAGMLVGGASLQKFTTPVEGAIFHALTAGQCVSPGTCRMLDFPSAALFLSFGQIWAVLLLHLLLAFPEGRVRVRPGRMLLVALYILVPLARFVWLVAPLRPVSTAYAVVTGETVYLACLVFGSVLILRRWAVGGYARRRSLSPVLWSLAPVVLAFVPWTAVTLSQAQVGPTLRGFGLLFLTALPVGFVVGMLRSGLDLVPIGSLVVKLSRGLLPEQLRPALAEVLHDPSLEVAYWVPTMNSFADLEGQALELPPPDSERAASILDGETGPVAALVYDSSLLLEPDLVDAAAAAARMALENARLQVQLRAQLEEVRQSRARLVEAGQQERQRVERDLHDGAQQQLVTLLLSLQHTKAEANRRSDLDTAALLDSNIASLKQALSELRELARGIYPSILTEAGLVPALRSLAERSPIPLEVSDGIGERRLTAQLEATLYFVATEAITNAVKHSEGRRICVSLVRNHETVVLDVSDDGQGGAAVGVGTGLRGLADRVAAAGGRLRVESDRRGTTIHCEIPCGS
ncbi:MAG TPA: histidine kinase [Candidatus Dormibacteraeota bacterium]|nr:histidine kinase [Candidatus Dormibacteraeota bacterium]